MATNNHDDDNERTDLNQVYGKVQGLNNIGLPVVEERTITQSIEPKVMDDDPLDPPKPTNEDLLDEGLYDLPPLTTKENSINQAPGDEVFVSPNKVDDAKTNSKSAVLSTPKARAAIAGGVIGTLLIIGGMAYAMKSDNKKIGQSESGQAGITLQSDPNAPLNEEQARHQMRNQQGEASELAAKGVTNAPVLAVANDPNAASATSGTAIMSPNDTAIIAKKYAGVNYRTADITAIPENERLAYANSQAAAGVRDAYYNEPLTNSSLYQPREQRGGEVLTYSNGNITIKPADYDQRLQRAIQSENSGGGQNTNANNGSGNSNNGGGNNSGNSSSNTSNANTTPAPDASYEATKQSLVGDYDAYMANQAQQQARIDQQRQAAEQQAQALTQQRQAAAKSAIGQAIQKITGSATGTGYNALAYGEKYSPTSAMSLSGATTTGGATNATAATTKTPSNILPKTTIRAGTSYPIIVTSTVNSDYGSTVVAQVASGPFKGLKVYGQIEPQGRNIGVSFTAIQPRNPRQALIPINAIALTFSNTNGVASKVDRHYLQNYLTTLAQATMDGYGNAYANANTTTTMNNDGVVVTSRGGVDNKVIRGQILGALGNRLNQDIGVFADRQPTYIINAGAPLNMTLVSNLDTTASTATIGTSDNRRSTDNARTTTRNMVQNATRVQ